MSWCLFLQIQCVIFHNHSKELCGEQVDPFEFILCLAGVASVQFKAALSV